MNSGEYQGHGDGDAGLPGVPPPGYAPPPAQGPPPGYPPPAQPGYGQPPVYPQAPPVYAQPGQRYAILPPTIPGKPDPNASPTQLEVASTGRRAGGALFDGLVSGVLELIVTLVVVVLAGEAYALSLDGADGKALSPKLVSITVATLTLIAYHAVMTGRTGAGNGLTFGKRAANIRIVTLDGLPISTAQAVRRAAAAWLPFGVVVAAGLIVADRETEPSTLLATSIGFAYLLLAIDVFVLPLTNERRQSFHDRVAGTVVVRYDRQRPASSAIPMAIATPKHGAGAWILGVLGTVAAAGLLFVVATSDPASTDAPNGQVAGTPGSAPAPAVLATDIAEVVARDPKAPRSAVEAQDLLPPLARQFSRCVGFAAGNQQLCVTPADLRLPANAFDFPAESVDAPAIGRRNQLGVVFKKSGRVIWLVSYDKSGRGWAYRFNGRGVSVKCYDGPVASCDRAKISPLFQAKATSDSFGVAAEDAYRRHMQGATSW